jgi:hypothetical protein
LVCLGFSRSNVLVRGCILKSDYFVGARNKNIEQVWPVFQTPCIA